MHRCVVCAQMPLRTDSKHRNSMDIDYEKQKQVLNDINKRDQKALPTAEPNGVILVAARPGAQAAVMKPKEPEVMTAVSIQEEDKHPAPPPPPTNDEKEPAFSAVQVPTGAAMSAPHSQPAVRRRSSTPPPPAPAAKSE